jgi:hypothetical protein
MTQSYQSYCDLCELPIRGTFSTHMGMLQAGAPPQVPWHNPIMHGMWNQVIDPDGPQEEPNYQSHHFRFERVLQGAVHIDFPLVYIQRMPGRGLCLFAGQDIDINEFPEIFPFFADEWLNITQQQAGERSLTGEQFIRINHRYLKRPETLRFKHAAWTANDGEWVHAANQQENNTVIGANGRGGYSVFLDEYTQVIPHHAEILCDYGDDYVQPGAIDVIDLTDD